jgi:hypothetical protein
VFRGTQEPLQEDCIFAYGTVTLYGWPFQTIQLTLSYPVWLLPHLSLSDRSNLEKRGSKCGPTTPDSPYESPGLGWSDFARHYYRNLG